MLIATHEISDPCFRYLGNRYLGARVDRSCIIISDEGESRFEISADHLGTLEGAQVDAQEGAQSGRRGLLVATALLQATLHGIRDGHFSVLHEVGYVLDGENLLDAIEADGSALGALLRQTVDRLPQLLLERLLLRELVHLVVIRVLQHATIVRLTAGLATRIIVDRILIGCKLSSFSTCQQNTKHMLLGLSVQSYIPGLSCTRVHISLVFNYLRAAACYIKRKLNEGCDIIGECQ